MNALKSNAAEQGSLLKQVVHGMRSGALVLSLLLGSSAGTALAADAPDLAIEVKSLPTLANPKLELKVTNISPNVRSAETGAQVVFQGGSPLMPSIPPQLTVVGGDGARIGSLNPGQSTTFSVDTPVFYCIEYPQRAASMGLAAPPLLAIATVNPAKSPAGVVETNQSNNGLQIPNVCQQYNTDVSNFRPEGVFPQVLIDRRPDEAHPQEVVFRVRNHGKTSAPATTVVVITSGSTDPNPKEFPVKALAPEESVTMSYVLTKPCTDQHVSAFIRKPGGGNYDDTIEHTFVCNYFAEKAAEAARRAAEAEALVKAAMESYQREHMPDSWRGCPPNCPETQTIAIDPMAARCTQFFRGVRNGRFVPDRDDQLLTQCNEVMGITQYCASLDGYPVFTYAANGSVNGQKCTGNFHKSSLGEEFEDLVTGIAEGLGDAYAAAAPFVTPVVSGIACVNGVLYSCAILALDVADLAGAGAPAGVARDALDLAHQVATCADGDVVACASVGQKGALAAGLDIPAADVAQVAVFVEKCSRNDFAACAKLGKAAAQTAGVPTNLPGNLLDAEDCLSTANGDACLALGKSASKAAGLLGTVTKGAENAQKCANGDEKACRELGHAVATLAR